MKREGKTEDFSHYGILNEVKKYGVTNYDRSRDGDRVA
jgi:hypothetical protein